MADGGHVPPATVAEAAARGLELREQFNRGGTAVGVRRAKQLQARRAHTDKEVVAMASYFKRHAVDKKATAHVWGDRDDPSAGYIAWLLWGGDAGEAWADRLKEHVDR